MTSGSNTWKCSSLVSTTMTIHGASRISGMSNKTTMVMQQTRLSSRLTSRVSASHPNPMNHSTTCSQLKLKAQLRAQERWVACVNFQSRALHTQKPDSGTTHSKSLSVMVEAPSSWLLSPPLPKSHFGKISRYAIFMFNTSTPKTLMTGRIMLLCLGLCSGRRPSFRLVQLTAREGTHTSSSCRRMKMLQMELTLVMESSLKVAMHLLFPLTLSKLTQQIPTPLTTLAFQLSRHELAAIS